MYIGKGQEACVDYEQSFRRDGDLYLPFLYKIDGRMSCCCIERAQQLSPSDPSTHEAQPANSGSGTRTTPSDPRAALASCSSCAAPGSWRSTSYAGGDRKQEPPLVRNIG